ncbi:MAG TPA: AAA family ATPase, partial [Pseudonocardia sp.]|nr:AAA family ATPase [Pseudonocardia sp.]
MSELPAAGRTGPVVHAVTKRDRPGAGVLASRLAVPQPRRQLVDREPLLERLSTGTEGPLTLVFGPAGAGKTYLVASWVTSGRAPGPVAWVTLDGDAAAPGAFWAYVVRALQGCGVSLGEDLGLPGRAEEIDRSFLARLAAALGEQPEPTVLVLDEYDQVSSAVIDAGLDFVLRNAAPSLRLVVIGRRRPRLRLARYRVAGELTEIGPAELAFTPEETGELLRLHGVPLPAPDVEDLTERTGGWVTGLRLTALALQREAGPVGARPVPAAAGGDIADFLLSEVVDAQPAATRDLLLRTCLLDRFTVELADALTGRSDGGSVLDALARNGTFVRPVPGTTSWFEYHRLFAEALRGRLRLRRPELVPGLHRRASQWLAEHGCLTEAVAHAVAAGDWGLAAGEVVDKLAVTRLLVGLETQRFGTLFAGLPPSGPTPEADLVRAALALARFDVAACLPALDRATAGTPEVAGPRQVAFRLAIAAVRVIVSRLTADLPAAETAGAEARRLMAEVPPDRLAQHPELPALVLSSLGTMQLWGGGSRDAAEESLSAGLAAAVGPSTEQSRSNCLGQLAFVHYLRGRLRTASACAVEALELADRAGLPPEGRVPVGHLAAAAVAWEWNDLPAVCTNVELAASSVAARHDVSIAVTVALIRSRHHRARGDPAGALRVLDGVAVQRARLPHGSFVIPMLAIEESMALLDAGRADRVAPTL